MKNTFRARPSGQLRPARPSPVRGFSVPRVLALIFVAVALAQGCVSGSQTSRPPWASDSTSQDSSGGTILCSPAAELFSGARPEYYLTDVINRKLAYYPELAAAVGLSAVHTCDEARTYVRGYTSYFQAHPYFDSNLPIDPALAKPPQVTHVAPADREVMKVLNGTATGPIPGPVGGPAPDFPVVRISSAILPGQRFFQGGAPAPADGTTCSGTFIAKNFILTAAHCFEDLALTFSSKAAAMAAGPVTQPGSQWVVEWPWTVHWPNPDGTEARKEKIVNAVSVVHPAYDGSAKPQPYPSSFDSIAEFGAAYDIALLWLPPQDNDFLLPADAAASSWAVQVANEDPFVSTWQLTMFGYGPTAEGGQGGILTMNTGPATGTTSTATPPFVASVITSPTINFATDWGACSGDSGGPLVRFVKDPLDPTKFIDTVIVGITSERDNPDDDAECPGPPGSNPLSSFARTDRATDFLELITQTWQPADEQNFDEPGVKNSYRKYFGKSCLSNCECAANQTCFLGGAAGQPDTVNNCFNPVCSDCSCVKGSCALNVDVDPDASVSDAQSGCD